MVITSDASEETAMPRRAQMEDLVSNFVEQVRVLVEHEGFERIRRTFVGGRAVTHGGLVSAQRRLQGRYLGSLRALRGAARKRVQSLARSRGVAAAVEVADRLRRK